MELFYAFLLAIANNLDTLGVRVAYSLKGIKITPIINLWMALIAFIISAGAAGSGNLVASFLPDNFAGHLTMVLFILMGILLIIEPYYNKIKLKRSRGETANVLHILADPIEADQDGSRHIDLKEATLLGLALSLNNIGGGLTAGMIGINWVLIGLLSALFSFIIFWAGNQIVDILKPWNMGNKASLIAGLLLIAIGISQIL